MSVNVGESINQQLTAEHTQKETQYTDMKKTVSLVNIDQK